MMKNRKKTTIFGLSAFVLILIATLVIMLQPEKEPDVTNDSEVLADNVIPNEIEDTAPTVTVEEVEPDIIIASELTTNVKVNDIQLTETVEKPEPPEKPEPDENQDLTDPDNKPKDVIVEPVEKVKETQKTANSSDKKNDKKENTKKDTAPKTTQPPAITAPKDSDKNNSKGDMVYVDGFGWVKRGGPNVVEESGSDGDWEKQIGSMD